MSESTGWSRPESPLPTEPVCDACTGALVEPYGWCGGCRKAYCFACGRAHFCKPTCQAGGCFAGLCVREVRGGRFSKTWGLPRS